MPKGIYKRTEEHKRKIGEAVKRPVKIRFWKKVNKINEDQCWNWMNSLRGSYGAFWNGKRNVAAHRFSWELHNGEIPKGLLVLHKCDNPLCVNPNHLFLGTYKDNMIDKTNKKRNNIPNGEQHHNSKLTEKEVTKIRKLYKTGKYTQRYLGEKFNIKVRNVHKIVNNHTWKHI